MIPQIKVELPIRQWPPQQKRTGKLFPTMQKSLTKTFHIEF